MLLEESEALSLAGWQLPHAVEERHQRQKRRASADSMR